MKKNGKAYNTFLETYTENVNNNNAANAKRNMYRVWNYNPRKM